MAYELRISDWSSDVCSSDLYASHNDLGTAALLAAMHEAGVDRMVLASSMVVYGEGRYACAEHGDQVPGPRSTAALDAGDFDNHCPRCGDRKSFVSGTSVSVRVVLGVRREVNKQKKPE